MKLLDKISELNGPVIIFDSTNSDELKIAIRDVAERFQLPTIGYNYCGDAHLCNIVEELAAPNNFYVLVCTSVNA